MLELLIFLIYVMLSLFLLTVTPSLDYAYVALIILASCSFYYLIFKKSKISDRLSFFGAFTFVYLGFFLVRAFYVLKESDFDAISGILKGSSNIRYVIAGIAWSTISLVSFILGGLIFNKIHQKNHRIKNKVYVINSLNIKNFEIDKEKYIVVILKIIVQLISIVIIYPISQTLSNLSLNLAQYSDNAYIYVLPYVGLGINLSVYTIATDSAVKYKFRNTHTNTYFFLATCLCLIYSYLIIPLSNSRQYAYGSFVVMGLIFALRSFQKINGLIFFSAISLLIPLIRIMGDFRSKSFSYIFEHINLLDIFTFDSYWNFFSSKGDFNIFDTFVVTLQYQPKYHPFINSILYVFVHWVPRSVWPSKPVGGVLVDQSHLHGIPFSPGLNGYFYLDGGYIWMIIMMFLTGSLICYLDSIFDRISSIQRQQNNYVFYLMSYSVLLISISMLTRSFLYQSTYYFLYVFGSAYLFTKVTTYLNKNLRKKLV